jgi:hypothetical protein
VTGVLDTIDNTHHGLLLVSNDDRVQPGTGFGTHSHRDMEIVTWVPAGQLTHEDSEGTTGAAALSSGDQLDEGDAARLTDATSLGLIAGDAGAETLVWVTA